MFSMFLRNKNFSILVPVRKLCFKDSNTSRVAGYQFKVDEKKTQTCHYVNDREKERESEVKAIWFPYTHNVEHCTCY